MVAIDPANPARDLWQSVIPEGEDAIALTEPSVTLVDHQLIVRTLHDARSRVVSAGLDGTMQHELKLPGLGRAVGFTGYPEQRETFYTFTDLITAPSVYRFDLGTAAILCCCTVTATLASRCCPTPVRRGLRWLKMGGIYAVANIRGVGEYGEAWHRQAIRAYKQVVFDDFIAAGEWLIAQRYTARDKLAIIGGSNGGLLVGACLTQRPDLVGAALAEVGVMDMLRFDRFGQCTGWTGDYGSPQDPEDFKALIGYSPVHNVRAGAHYAAMLVITGDHDTRVMPMHSFKFAAALPAAQVGSAPVLLYLEFSSGHGGGTTVTQAIDQTADIYAFLAKNLHITARP